MDDGTSGTTIVVTVRDTVYVSTGSSGDGQPSAAQVAQCQEVAGGEMIYDPTADAWTCEPQALPQTGGTWTGPMLIGTICLIAGAIAGRASRR